MSDVAQMEHLKTISDVSTLELLYEELLHFAVTPGWVDREEPILWDEPRSKFVPALWRYAEMKAAIDAGYSKAFSAIFDANVTTFFVAAILYSFGVGPIQGFAVTLMAGILSSLFTAIIVSRIVFDYMVIKRRMNVSYG